jgi:hypothetical protein
MSPLRRVEVGLSHVFRPSEEAEEAGQVPFPEGVLTCPVCGFDGLHLLRVGRHQDASPGGFPAGAAALRVGCGAGHRFCWQLTVHGGRLLASLEDVLEGDG